MKRTLRIRILSILIVLLGLTIVYSLYSGATKTSDDVQYSHMSIFGNQDSYVYPSFVDFIRTENLQTTGEIYFGPVKEEGFEFFMRVARIDNSKIPSETERGWKEIGNKVTKNGYTGKIFASDLHSYPEENVKTCDFSYMYILPLLTDNTKSTLISVQISDQSWNGGECALFEKKNYQKFKKIIDTIFEGAEPTN